MKNFFTSWLRLLVALTLLLGAAYPFAGQAQQYQWTLVAGEGEGRATAVDAAGNVYVAGNFRGTATFGTVSLTSTGGFDAFVAKFTSAGTCVWAVRGGGSASDNAVGVAVDASGNVYITGDFAGTATFGTFSLTNSSFSFDAFVAKLNSSGVYQWVTRAGGVTGSDSGKDVAVDASGNVYVTGNFGSSTATFGTISRNLIGVADGFVAKLNGSGVFQWVETVSSTGSDDVSGVAVDGSGNVVVTGRFSGVVFLDLFGLTSAGSTDAFVGKLDPAGAWQWAIGAGGTSFDSGTALAVDASGSVYVAGEFQSLTATFGGITLVNSNSIPTTFASDAFVAQLAPDGGWQWVQQTGGASSESARGLAVDAAGYVYIAGIFQGTAATFGATSLSNSGGASTADAFTAKLTAATGAWKWAVGAGGTDFDTNDAVAVDGGGNVYTTGYFFSPTATFGSMVVGNPTNQSEALCVSRLTQAPALTTLAPAAGAAGTTITLTGINVYNIASVSFGGVLASNFTCVSNTTLTAVVPPGAVTGPLTVTNAYGAATSATTFTVLAQPTVLAFTPAVGLPTTTVVLSGANLTGTTSVRFNSVNATFTVNSATQITATVPTGATTGPVTVTTPGGSVTTTALFTVPGPTGTAVTSFAPSTAFTGQLVTLTGANFTGATAVSFNGTPAPTFTVLSATQISVVLPAGATTGPVSVTSPSGTGQSSAFFIVSTIPIVFAMTPTSGGTGTPVVITGLNFRETLTVAFGSTPATFTIDSDTQLTVTVPAGAATGVIRITTQNGTTTTLTFTILAAPTITSFTPTTGQLGTLITVTGTNLSGVTALRVNGVAATSLVVTGSTQVRGVVASNSNLGAGAATVQVVAPNGITTAASRFTITGTVGLAVDSVRAVPATQVVIPVRATTAIANLIALQGSITFAAPEGLTFANVESFGLSGLTAASFGTTGAAAGQLTFVWNSANNLAVSLAANAVVFAIRFNVGATVPLGTTLAVRLVNAPTPVELTNSAFASLTFTTRHGKGQVPGSTFISGTVRTGNLTPVTGVTMGVSGPVVPAAPSVSLTDGTYNVSPLMRTGAYTITPRKTNDVTVSNGVTAADVALVQRHILGTTLLGAAYKAVSADANGDNAITVADVGLMQGFILGNTTSFPGALLWRFFSAVGANPNSPWPITQTRTYASANVNSGQDFTACKLGDVNDSWNPAIPRPLPVAPGTPAAELQLLDAASGQPVQPGQPVRLIAQLIAHATNPHALQTTLAWDRAVLRLRPVASLAAGAVAGRVDNLAGRLPLLWTDPSAANAPQQLILAELIFDVVATPPTGTTSVSFTDEQTPTLAADNVLAPLALLQTAITIQLDARVTGIASSVASQPLTLTPNPARTSVRVQGTTANTAVVLIDTLGREVLRTATDADGAAPLDVRGLSPGIYFVRTPTSTRRLVIE